MVSIEFEEFMREMSFSVQDKIAYGDIEGYPVIIKNRGSLGLELRFYLEGEPWQQIREDMCEFAKLYKSSVYYTSPYLVWKIRIHEKEYTRFREWMDGVRRILNRKGVQHPKTCVLCGKEGADAYAIIQEGNQPVHRDCLQEQLTIVRQRNDSGSYVLGLLGGLLGGIVGLLPSVLALQVTHHIYCILFLFLPPAIYYGCKWLRGKMNLFVLFLSVVLSVFGVYVMEFAMRIQYNLELQQLPQNLHYCMEVLQKLLAYDGIWMMLTKSAGLNLIFVAIGIFINWELISQTSLKAEENIVRVINTTNFKK